MSVFDAYARYYDLVNKDKDYAAEAEYVSSLIRQYRDDANSLLDLGCGTGRHAELFADSGFQVVGLDKSEAMVKGAKARRPDIAFRTGDICDFELGIQFDVVSALFHVVSYLTEENQLQAAFRNICKHLAPGGLLIFDCWHGPAVLSQRPEVRVRRLAGDGTRVVRIAEPDWKPEKNRVDVNFQIFVEENGSWAEFSEKHPMRYLFRPEVEKLLSDAGMRHMHTQEWLTGENPSEDSWSVVYVAQIA